jgi:hypothetical protein
MFHGRGLIEDSELLWPWQIQIQIQKQKQKQTTDADADADADADGSAISSCVISVDDGW